MTRNKALYKARAVQFCPSVPGPAEHPEVASPVWSTDTSRFAVAGPPLSMQLPWPCDEERHFSNKKHKRPSSHMSKLVSLKANQPPPKNQTDRASTTNQLALCFDVTHHVQV
jgi:hypothetical protein